MREYLILHMSALAAGIVLDVVIGDPLWLWHPIRAIGALISHLERRLRKSRSHDLAKGALLWLIVIIVTTAVTSGLLAGAYILNRYAGFAVEAILTFYILAAGSLRDESMKVFHALNTSDAGADEAAGRRLDPARQCLSMIVGRDTGSLDEPGIVRATVETVAENTSDGVIAPLLFTFFGTPVLGMLYKAVNTMDSMLGYHNDEYEYFGKFAARADDVANFIPSRLSALFMSAAAGICGIFGRIRPGRRSFTYSGSRAFRIWLRDRYKHKSPNSAQTESACAGALGVRLGGSSRYKGVLVEKPYIGDDTRPVEADDIRRAIRLMLATEVVCTAVIYIITGLILIFR